MKISSKVPFRVNFGGCGHLLLFSEPLKKFNVIQELEKVGGKIIKVQFLGIWRIFSKSLDKILIIEFYSKNQ